MVKFQVYASLLSAGFSKNNTLFRIFVIYNYNIITRYTNREFEGKKPKEDKGEDLFQR